MHVFGKLSSSPVEDGWLEDQSTGRTPSQGSGTTQPPEAGGSGTAGDRAGAGEGTSQRNVQVTMTGSGDGLKGAGEGGATSRTAGV